MAVSRTEAAAAIGMDESAIRKAEREGRIRKPRNGKYKPEKLAAQMAGTRQRMAVDGFKRRGKAAKGEEKASPGLDVNKQASAVYAAERAREKRNEREQSDLKLALLRKVMIRRADVERDAEECASLVKESLYSMVDRVVPLLGPAEAEHRRLLLSEIDQILDGLANSISRQSA